MTDPLNETVETEYLEMSDEDFLSGDYEEVTNVEEASDEQSEEAEAEETEEKGTPNVELEGDALEGADDEEDESEESEETSEGTSDANEESSDESSEEEATEDDVEDFEAMYKAMLEPIQANGRQNTVKTVEEARKFMSMGMGYTKRMEGLKSARLLEQKMKEHNLLDEGKLDFLIALDKKNPEAIAKMLKDAKLDPLKIDMESDSSYQPEAYSGGEDSLALDDVITELENSSHAPDIAELISTKWGESSREILRSKPALLNIIDSHMEVGIYDSIMDRVEQEKMLGSYMGVSDIEAYGQTAERMKSEGQFNHLFNPAQGKQVESKPATITKAIIPQRKVDPNLEQKKASATTKSKPASKKTPKAYLDMTDEEFLASM
jgi:hypothetical protein